ncbi:MAG: hypothetical protein PVG14_15685 [Anaerolineales bacterium]
MINDSGADGVSRRRFGAVGDGHGGIYPARITLTQCVDPPLDRCPIDRLPGSQRIAVK